MDAMNFSLSNKVDSMRNWVLFVKFAISVSYYLDTILAFPLFTS